MSSAFQPLPEVVEATDEAGSVTVTLEDHGKRVSRVLVAANWQDKVGPEGLGNAVMEAVLTTQLGPTADFFENAANATPTPAPTLDPPGQLPDLEGIGDSQLAEMLETVEKALDAVVLGQQDLPDMSDEEIGRVSGFSENRKVEVSFLSGQLSSVKVDEKWVGTASRQKVSESLVEAFDAAYEADAQRVQNPPPGAGLATSLQSIIDRVGIKPNPKGL